MKKLYLLSKKNFKCIGWVGNVTHDPIKKSLIFTNVEFFFSISVVQLYKGRLLGSIRPGTIMRKPLQ